MARSEEIRTVAGASNNDGSVIATFDDAMRLAFTEVSLQGSPTSNLREQQEDSKVGTRRAVNAAPLILFARALLAQR